MESGQFETLVEVNEDGPEEAGKRFECEGTELELNEESEGESEPKFQSRRSLPNMDTEQS